MAVYIYESIPYPYSYLNPDWVAKEILLTAHKLAADHVAEKEIRSAYRIMEDAFYYCECSKWLDELTPAELNERIEKTYGTWTKDSLAMMLSDYALLMKANGYDEEARSLIKMIESSYGEGMFKTSFPIDEADFFMPNRSWYELEGQLKTYHLQLYADDDHWYLSGYDLTDSMEVHWSGINDGSGVLSLTAEDRTDPFTHWLTLESTDNGKTYDGEWTTDYGEYEIPPPEEVQMTLIEKPGSNCDVIVTKGEQYVPFPIIYTGNRERDYFYRSVLNVPEITNTELQDYEAQWHLEDEFERHRGLTLITGWDIMKNDHCILSLLVYTEFTGAYTSY